MNCGSTARLTAIEGYRNNEPVRRISSGTWPTSQTVSACIFCWGREVGFDKDFECVADDLRVFITEGTDALLQLGEGRAVPTAPRWRASMTLYDC
jgi:hypothetical protein